MGRFLNALLGAIVTVVLAALPFSPVLGGAIAGFFEGTDGTDAALTGALSGLITLLPLAGVGVLLFSLLGIGIGLGAPPGGVAIAIVFFGAIAAAFVVYTVGFAALGGYIGAMLASEYPRQRADLCRTIGISIDDGSRPQYDSTRLE
ncbi:DUF5518 domain-containing protein [Halobacteria archaeon AArc-m2/3/4]|uniref:DUF5518 domain-containing protein n=1 Tax=Natronoglomus mannanivorans TaxID=2979990 RepID=A0ABT2QB82_9EURY|nr:DUF5518 domain-containing protein [Halobacteria archaeon AArc-m2/3/4]